LTESHSFDRVIMLSKAQTHTSQLPRTARFALTLDHVWLAAALVLLALRPLLTPIPPHDFWWHLATGRIIVAQHAIPTLDSFSYTRTGLPFYNQGWLAQVLMYGIYQAGGLALTLLVQAALIALAYGLLLRLCIVRTGRLRLSVALLLLTTLPLSFDNWNVRPQSYAFPLFVGFLVILTEFRLGRRNRLWLLPLLMLLWVNIHGTFILGLGLIGLTFVGELLKSFERRAEAPSVPADAPAEATPQSQEQIGSTGGFDLRSALALLGAPVADDVQNRGRRLRRLLVWGALTTLAVLVNPRGLGVVGYVRNLLGSNAVTTLVTEWAPPTIRDAGGIIFFLFLIGCGIVLIYARRRPDPTDMLFFGAFLWLALGAVRNIVWFGFVATPLIAVQFSTLLAPPRAARRPAGVPVLNAVLIGMLGLLLVGGLPWIKPTLLPPSVGSLLMEDTPVAAVAAMRAQPDRPRHLFHAMGYGSYLIWAAPEQPVFIDPRIELYPYEQWRDYINLGQANNVAELLRTYDIDGLLLSKHEQEALVKAVRADPAWQIRYEDVNTIYLIKR
jgi:hypothetical protein